MSDLLSESPSLPLLERHRTPPSGEEILDRFVERYASRPLGARVGAVAAAPVPEPASEEPTVLFTMPAVPEVSPEPISGTDHVEEEATRMLEVPPEAPEEGSGTPTMAFEAMPGEAPEEATRMLEVPPEAEEDGGPGSDSSGTPTMAMVPGDASKKRKKRRHR